MNLRSRRMSSSVGLPISCRSYLTCTAGSLMFTMRRRSMGYSEQQLRDLETTINASGADVVVIGTPMDLRRIVNIKLPAVQVKYDLQEIGSPTLADILRERKFI